MSDKVPMKRSEIFKELEHEIQFFTEHTKQQYRSHVSDYLDWLKEKGKRDWSDRTTLYEYLDHLKKRRLIQSTINGLVRSSIGALFRMYGLKIPVKLPRLEMPHSMADHMEKMQFTYEEILQFIQAALKGTPEEKAIFAIATIYGPRIGELQRITSEDVHPKKKTFVIHTEKGGYPREHEVPPAIQPYIFGYDYPLISNNRLYAIFAAVRKRAGIEQRPRKSYHAIRHGVSSVLRYKAGLDKDTVHKFQRWKDKDIVDLYAPYDPENDQKVFKKHPFLKCWE